MINLNGNIFYNDAAVAALRPDQTVSSVLQRIPTILFATEI